MRTPSALGSSNDRPRTPPSHCRRHRHAVKAMFRCPKLTDQSRAVQPPSALKLLRARPQDGRTATAPDETLLNDLWLLCAEFAMSPFRTYHNPTAASPFRLRSCGSQARPNCCHARPSGDDACPAGCWRLTAAQVACDSSSASLAPCRDRQSAGAALLGALFNVAENRQWLKSIAELYLGHK
jgi:hypothetical protein